MHLALKIILLDFWKSDECCKCACIVVCHNKILCTLLQYAPMLDLKEG